MRTENFRKTVNAIIILLLAMLFTMNAALCEQTAWDCPECGRMGNMGNYCGNCAHPAPWMGTADDKDTESTQMDASAFQKINNIVTFGHYEQDNDLSNGPEEIEWIVLDFDEKDHKALLISRYGLDAKPYNEKWNDITWENCTLRKWLNDEFLKEAFDTDEQVAIIVSEVKNSASQGFVEWNSYGGNNTKDQIFLLSYAETRRYFSIDNYQQNIAARVAPTAYAVTEGTLVSNSSRTSNREGTAWWCLRSPGPGQSSISVVIQDGSLGHKYVNDDRGAVRPAIWLNLDPEYARPAPWTETENNEDAEKIQKDVSVFQKKNNIVTFGHYEQDNNSDNGPEEIEWIVLDYDGNEHKALLLSRYGLDTKPYNVNWGSDPYIWENSTLRTWMNGEFLQQAFSEEEQDAILMTEVNNNSSQGYSAWKMYGGKDTKDRMFLLSCAEANRYLGVKYKEKNTKSRVSLTAYAIAQGAWRSASAKTIDGEEAGWWWLRSPGSHKWNAALVIFDGSLHDGDVSDNHNAVRPAFWLNLESDFF